MDIRSFGLRTASLLGIVAMSACAGMDSVISSPVVTLTRIEVTDADFDRQTFLLGFDVSNPNPFPLPIRSVRYRVRLGEQQFAGGETQGHFTVPAEGAGAFAISVELNLLKTTSNIFSLVRSGSRRDLSYELSGSFTVDIPLAKPLEFSNSGTIALQAAAF